MEFSISADRLANELEEAVLRQRKTLLEECCFDALHVSGPLIISKLSRQNIAEIHYDLCPIYFLTCN